MKLRSSHRDEIPQEPAEDNSLLQRISRSHAFWKGFASGFICNPLLVQRAEIESLLTFDSVSDAWHSVDRSLVESILEAVELVEEEDAKIEARQPRVASAGLADQIARFTRAA